MSKYVMINPEHGGSDSGNESGTTKESDYTLKIGKEIQKNLNQVGIANTLIRDKDETISESTRLQNIVSNSPDSKDTLILTLGIDSPSSEIEIIYALRNSNKLASLLSTTLEDNGYTVSKYYQRRLPSDTSKDYDEIIRETGKRESLIIQYGNFSDVSFIQENWQALADLTATAVETYFGTVGTYYTVQKGDSLYSIAQKYGVTVDEIKKANSLGTNTLSIGEKLLIPEKEETNEEYYIVKSGDTLYNIATKYGVTVDNLYQTNQLTSTTLKIGQKLLIPTSTSTTTYVVQKGDTLYSIASQYGITVDNLKQLNHLSSNTLQIGQKISIPMKEESNDEITYTVKKGDNLYNLAIKYGVTVEDIKKKNNLASNILSIGEVLVIPTSSTMTIYTVQKGDSLYSIGQKYQVSVSEIMNLNHLTTTILQIGDELLIPN